MTDTGAVSPRASRLATPGWLDTRLVLGVLLVLASVVLGARVLASADQSTSVWVTTRPLAAGTQIGEDDLEPGRARLFGEAASYLAGQKPVGYLVLRSVGEGELLPAAALGRPGEQLDYRAVAVPVTLGHLAPDLRSGQQVDVWVTPEADREAAAPPRLVLRAVTVLQRPEDTVGESEEAVVLQVPTALVPALLAAVAEGGIDLVRVPVGSEAELPLTPAG